jgi:hypothetical protein
MGMAMSDEYDAFELRGRDGGWIRRVAEDGSRLPDLQEALLRRALGSPAAPERPRSPAGLPVAAS